MVFSILQKKIEIHTNNIDLDQNFLSIKASDRPDLSDFQCNGALQAAKLLKKNPREIAEKLKELFEKSEIFEKISIDGPGFINLTLSDKFIIESIYGSEWKNYTSENLEKIVIDYGGPNVAKPLHIGHLRSSIIGESIKKTAKELGHKIISDIHLGDWGTPIGMLIAKLEEDFYEWFHSYSNEEDLLNHFPISNEDLNNIYPIAAQKFKENAEFAEKSRLYTSKLQFGEKKYVKIWKYIVQLSVENIKKDFDILGVNFDYWYGESDSEPFMEEITEIFISSNIAYKSDGAFVIDVKEETDKTEIPPLILKKSDGAATYSTTDLATILQRKKQFDPDKILYVVDQRQSLHFEQVFRSAEKAGLFNKKSLEHIAFGTMNGKDGRPFKTRSGGVMKLSELINNTINLTKLEAGFCDEDLENFEINDMIKKIALSAIKFGDLSNVRTSDYIFDIEEFVKFEGRTGPYVLYAAVRASSILEKFKDIETRISPLNSSFYNFTNKEERDLSLEILNFSYVMQKAFKKRMPSELCDYAYNLASKFNAFYHNSHIISEQNYAIQNFRLKLVYTTRLTLVKTLYCLGIEVPEKMIRKNTIQ